MASTYPSTNYSSVNHSPLNGWSSDLKPSLDSTQTYLIASLISFKAGTYVSGHASNVSCTQLSDYDSYQYNHFESESSWRTHRGAGDDNVDFDFDTVSVHLCYVLMYAYLPSSPTQTVNLLPLPRPSSSPSRHALMSSFTYGWWVWKNLWRRASWSCRVGCILYCTTVHA